jgi:hypothetical protein
MCLEAVFGGKADTPKVEPLPPIPTKDDDAVQRKAEDARLAGKRRMGLLNTIRTSGRGVTGEGNNNYKTLGA